MLINSTMPPLAIIRASVEAAAAILQLQREAYQSEARLHNDWEIPRLMQTLHNS